MKSFLLALAILATAVHASQGELKAGVFDPPRAAPDFSLKGSDGGELKLSAYRGKVVVLGFGFTNCEFVCPTTLATLAKARKKLGPEGKKLQVVYVTVDPERDNPQRMRTYLTAFDPTFLGGTGTEQQLAGVRKDYGIVATKKAGSDPAHYSVDHSSFVYLIDREGRLRALSPYGRSADDIAHDVAILLKK
ncbi:MAG TPA: SCO family protein [Usitatibacter sp.]|nr:SCO family protein [Usitatibacter sp.]